MGRRLVMVAAGMAMLSAACTGGGPPTPSPQAPSRGAPSPPTSPPPRGGEITIGVEQWPECLNPITGCGGRALSQTVLYHVLPRAMEYASDGTTVASALLTEAPTLANGGLTQAPFTVTFPIRPEAVWDDGSPITSEDIAFTWRAILHTRGSILADDYRRIVAIDTPDPKTAVLRFRDRFAGWPELFGGSKGFVLKKGVDGPNLAAEFQTSVPFSGGPFRLHVWQPSSHEPQGFPPRAVLVRNERYFGRPALLDRVTFVPVYDPLEEQVGLARGDADIVSPDVEGLLQRSGLIGPGPIITPGTPVEAIGGDGQLFEALWFNPHEPPLDDPLVREALMYAIDRQTVIEKLVSEFNADAQVLNCGFLALPTSPQCRSQPFERFAYDPAKSLSLLEQAGYDCSKLPCTKNGKPLEVRYESTSISPLSATSQELIIEDAAHAGFQFKVVTFEAGVLFPTTACPFPDVAVSGCAVRVPPDGSPTPWLSCAAVPKSPSQRYDHLNRIEWCDREADELMRASDLEIDPALRQQLLDRVAELEAEDMIGLPLFVRPVVLAWRTDRVAGPLDRYLSSPYGPFFNLSEWYRAP